MCLASERAIEALQVKDGDGMERLE